MGVSDRDGDGNALAWSLRDRREAVLRAWEEALHRRGDIVPDCTSYLPLLLDLLADVLPVAGPPPEHRAAPEMQQQIQAILDVLPAGVFVTDRFGRLHAANAAVHEIWGDPLPEGLWSEIQDRFIAFRVTDGQRVRPRDWPLSRALAGETVLDQELDIVRFDGRCGTILVSAAPIPGAGGEVAGAATIAMDVSERRRATRDRDFLAGVSRALSESLDYDATLRRLVDLAVPRLADWCAIDLAGPDGVRRVAMADTVPERARAVAAFTRRWANDPADASIRVIETRKPIFSREVTEKSLRRYFRVDDDRTPDLLALGLRSFMAVPLVARGRALGAMLFAQTPTSRRFTENDLRLAREVAVWAALAVDNAVLYRDLREAIRARDDLWAVAAHELKNPLSAMLLLCQATRRAVERGEPGVLEKLEKAERQVRRLSALVGELLDSTRAQSGRLDIHAEKVDLAAVALDVVERHRPEARVAGVSIDFEARARPVGCWDSGRLDQVITNLIGNALKHGGGSDVRVEVDRIDGEAVLRVADRGPGIPAEHQARVFKPFERVAEGPRRQGLGLGLYIVRRIVEAHGGRIELASAPGAGTVFTVRLPVGESPSKSHLDRLEAAEPASG